MPGARVEPGDKAGLGLDELSGGGLLASSGHRLLVELRQICGGHRQQRIVGGLSGGFVAGALSLENDAVSIRLDDEEERACRVGGARRHNNRPAICTGVNGPVIPAQVLRCRTGLALKLSLSSLWFGQRSSGQQSKKCDTHMSASLRFCARVGYRLGG